MNENNELLLYIYQNTLMGLKSTKQLLNLLNKSDNKIKPLVEEELKEYEELEKTAKKYLKRNKVSLQEPNLIAKISATIGINFEFLKDNSDSKIADMLIRGFTMGNIEIDKKLDKFNGKVDKSILKLAKEIKKNGEKNIEKLKSYL